MTARISQWPIGQQMNLFILSESAEMWYEERTCRIEVS